VEGQETQELLVLEVVEGLDLQTPEDGVVEVVEVGVLQGRDLPQMHNLEVVELKVVMEEIIVPLVEVVGEKEHLGNQVLLELKVMLQIVTVTQETLVLVVTLVIREMLEMLETQVI
jgi:hypothetical protein